METELANQEESVSLLVRAIEIAIDAHKGVTDKGGSPYVFHPLRMMMAVNTRAEKIVAVLHDVVEDSEDWDIPRLRAEGFLPEDLKSIKAVTHKPGESYQDYILRVVEDPVARVVKIADLRDNLDVTRIGELTDKDTLRLNKYKVALTFLTS